MTPRPWCWLVVVLSTTPVTAVGADRLTLWTRGPKQLVAAGPAALRVGTQRSSSATEVGPWPGARVEVFLEGKGRRLALGDAVADPAGEASVRFVTPDWPSGEYALVLESTADGAKTSARQPVTVHPSARLLLQSDKPLYQPGQLVHLRALAMRPFDARPLADAKVTFEVLDPRDNRVFREQKRSSAFGVSAADFQLGPEVTLGTWKARVSSDAPGAEPHELELKVERYALPKFKVSVEPDQGFYRPGAKAKLSLEARYFFGKPVARGKAKVSLTGANEVRVALEEMRAVLDDEGRGSVELALPSGAPGALTVRVEVTDSAEHVERATRSLTVADKGVQAELVVDGPALLAGVGNPLWVVAARPDGTPLEGAAVELSVNQAQFREAARSDGLGIATLTVRPEGSGCLPVKVRVRAQGELAENERCVPVQASPARCTANRCAEWPLQLRTDRALYPAGAPLRLEVLAPGARGTVLVDVVKDALTVDTTRIEVLDGRGEVTLAPDERRFGALQLQASWAGASGQGPGQRRARHQRLVYVERPGTLSLSATATRPGSKEAPASFRPGERAELTLKVVDADTQAPVRASVGLVMVDQALLALRPVRPELARAYFHLSKAAAGQLRKPKLLPGGLDFAGWVERGGEGQERAARVLLAGATPPWDVGVETDGFARLAGQADEQLERLDAAVERYQRGHLLGERVPGTKRQWRWRQALLEQLVADQAVRRADAVDPWGKRVPLETVTRSLGEFSSWADEDAGARLTEIYQALARELAAGRLAKSNDKRPLVLVTQADLDRVLSTGELAALATDPWGKPWRLVERKSAKSILGLRSRQLVASDGPDGVAGTGDDRFAADASALAMGSGVLAVLGSGVPNGGLGRFGLGMRGVGLGGGGFGMANARSVTVRLGAASVMGAEGRSPAKVRSEFPETLLWQPELLTDERGEGRLTVELADSITTWVLSAEAVDEKGRLGHATLSVPVMQDFFADLDLPPVMTQHDELSVPVAVYNYLSAPQRVTLRLDDAGGISRLDGQAAQSIDLGPGEVGVRYFRVRAERVGRHALTVHADSGTAQDSVRREVEVFPDGLEKVASFQDRLGKSSVRHRLFVPASAIQGTPRATFKLFPGMGAQAIDGLDSMLRLPSGCFEQTSSTTYPNALILDYLRRTKKANAQVEERARRYLSAGYQKLLSYEVRGGGFSWFGEAPANKVLTAYGLEEFVDMAKVYPVDPRVIERTRAWLLARQHDDGHWPAERSPINEGATDRFEQDTLRTTAFIALSLHKAGAPKDSVRRAASYVAKRLGRDADAYTLALVSELFARTGERPLADRLWSLHVRQGQRASFPESKGGTLTHGAGKSGEVETTARAALSLLAAGAPTERVEAAVAYLVASKDSFGNWHSTQATIRSLQSLLEYEAARGRARNGTVVVEVDGKEVSRLEVVGTHQLAQAVELPAATVAGEHEVSLRYEGQGELSYQLVASHFEPRAALRDALAAMGSAVPVPSVPPLSVETQLSREKVRVGDEVSATVAVATREAVAMPVVRAGLPPGYFVDEASLEKLVLDRRVDKYERGVREVVFYLTKLDPAHPLELPFKLVARMPGQVQVPAPEVYEYYRPENSARGEVTRLSSTL